MRLRSAWIAAAAAVAILGCVMIVYATSENDYLGDGTSRWDSRHAQGLTATAVIACAGAAGLALFASRSQTGIAARGLAMLAIAVALVIWIFALVGNTAN